MIDSDNFLRTERPLPIDKKVLYNNASCLEVTYKKEHSRSNQLERALGIPLTRIGPIEIKVENREDTAYLLGEISRLESAIEKIRTKNSRLETELKESLQKYNAKLTNGSLELIMPMGESVTTKEEFLEKIREIKSLADRFQDKVNSISIYLDFRRTKSFKFYWEKELLRSLRMLNRVYGEDKLNFDLEKYPAAQEHRLKKAAQKIISRDISIKQEQTIDEEEAEHLEKVKKHTIKGPDLRPWPMIEHNLVGIEEYNPETKMHVRKGYKRVIHPVYEK